MISFFLPIRVLPGGEFFVYPGDVHEKPDGHVRIDATLVFQQNHQPVTNFKGNIVEKGFVQDPFEGVDDDGNVRGKLIPSMAPYHSRRVSGSLKRREKTLSVYRLLEPIHICPFATYYNTKPGEKKVSERPEASVSTCRRFSFPGIFPPLTDGEKGRKFTSNESYSL
jgi:hypothetical protein